MKKLAPIILFVYNRPWHAQQTLEALAKNELANESILYIFADGPKEGMDEVAVNKLKETRSIIRSKQWCKNVTIIESEFNKGLANSIVDGVTNIVNKHDKVIVLEDDIVTSVGFLKYMNDALNFYENVEKVMHISGYVFPLKGKLPETFFFNINSCWGWGTWKRAWDKFESDPIILKEKVMTSPGGVNRFDIEGGYNFFSHLEDNISGKLKTWAIKWHATMFINDGYSLHPGRSLVNNIGHDNSGANCIETNIYWWDKLADKIEVQEISIIESGKIRKKVRDFFLHQENRWIKIIKKRLKAIIRNES